MSAAVAGLHAGLAPATGRSGLWGAVRSEYVKLRSLRSTVWVTLSLVVVTVGMGALFAFGHARHIMTTAQNASTPQGLDPVRADLSGLIIGQLVIAVIAAMTITSEYSTGMIRTSLTSMPRRGNVLAAKGIVLTAYALVVGMVSAFASFFVGNVFWSHASIDVFGGGGKGDGPPQFLYSQTRDLSLSLGDHGVLRSVVGAGLYLTVSALLAFGLGALLRHTAGAVTAAIGALFVAHVMGLLLPPTWRYNTMRWIPFDAGSSIWGLQPFVSPSDAASFAPWTGLGVFALYAVAALAAGAYVFRKRDA